MLPYTYLIGWSHLNLYYYGVRYAKNCHPCDLWKKYKTSSVYVKNIYQQYGDPDIIEIRKTFSTPAQAMAWEYRVLKRLNVVENNIWINKTDNAAIDFKTSKRTTGPGRLAALKVTSGKTYEEIHGEKKAAELKTLRRISSKARWDNHELRVRMSLKPANTDKYKSAALRRWNDPQRKQEAAIRMKEMWINRKSQQKN
jgi:hypothetical protein